MVPAKGNLETWRLFLAVEPPFELKQALLALAKDFPLSAAALKWTAPQNLHLTLHFIGAWPVPGLPALLAGLEQISFKAFPLELQGLGLFKPKQQTVLWAGIIPSLPLQALRGEIVQTLKTAGAVSQAPGRYTPHITLARVKKTDLSLARELACLKVQKQGQNFGKFTVSAFSLFKSELRPQGPLYTCLRNFAAN